MVSATTPKMIAGPKTPSCKYTGRYTRRHMLTGTADSSTAPAAHVFSPGRVEGKRGAALRQNRRPGRDCTTGGNQVPHVSEPLAASDNSVPLPGGNELKIFHRHLGEECLVLALRQRPQDRRALIAGIPVLAAAHPNGPGKGGAEPGEEFLGRGGGRRDRGAAGPGLGDQPHDTSDLLVEAERHRHVVDRGERPVEHE